MGETRSVNWYNSPHISIVALFKEAWDRLLTIFANKSRARVMSVKEKMINNSQGNRSINEYLQDIRNIVNDLALVDSPIDDDDAVLQIWLG